MSKSKSNKDNPNAIGTVTIKISPDGKLEDYVSSLSSSKGLTTLYVPRFKSIKQGDNLMRALQRYIGIKRGDYSKKDKWLKNAQHLFMDKAAVETFLARHTQDTPSDTTDPNIVIDNAQFIIQKIYFPTDSPFRYNDKQWSIEKVVALGKDKTKLCTLQKLPEVAKLAEQYKERQLKDLNDKYIKLLAAERKGITDETIRKSIKKKLDDEFFLPKLDKLRTDVNDYIKGNLDVNTDIYKKLKQFVEKGQATAALASPVICKLKLDLKSKELKKRVPVKTTFKNFKESCRKGFHPLSAKQRKIVAACRRLCETPKYPKWCKTCSVLINCIMEPDDPIFATAKQAQTKKNATLGSLPKGWTQDPVTGKTQAPAWSKTKKKVPVAPKPSTTGGRRSRKYRI